jgi:pimeloyl-ACP methyl ester carboxylesterase
MNDVDELKRFVVVHARAQGIPRRRYARILDEIDDDGDGARSWTRAWCREAERYEAAGRALDACRHYNMARFPYVDGPARAEAHERCVAVFDRWRRGTGHIEPLDLDLDGGRVRCWTTGLSTAEPRPLLVVMGGIVSIKEQWAPVLVQAHRLGFAGLVAEMPGVGENTLPYRPDSWRMLTDLLDAVAGRAEVDRTYAVALSFSGHLALRAAAEDDRIRGIITVGAPVARVFADPEWQRDLPRVTRDTLSHISGVPVDALAAHLRPFELDEERLAAVRVPVAYTASRRDEIIPAEDVERLRRCLAGFHVIENDDVHGSPRHTTETRLWIVRSLLRMAGGAAIPSAAVTAAFHATRLRSRIVHARA